MIIIKLIFFHGEGLTYTSPSQPALKKPISSCCMASDDTRLRCPCIAVMNCPGSWRTVNKLICPFCPIYREHVRAQERRQITRLRVSLLTSVPAKAHSASECMARLVTGDREWSSTMESGVDGTAGFSHHIRSCPDFIVPSTTAQCARWGAVRNDLPFTAANTS